MSKTLALRIAVFVSALFFLPPILLAQHHGGGHHGGGRHGGGHHGGGHHGGGHHGRGHHGGGHHGGGDHGGHRHHGGHGGIGFGWWGGYYSPYSYYGPYGGYGYYGRYPYSYRGYSLPDWAAIDTDIAPEEAEVYLDGRYLGIADDFDGYPDYLYLEPGKYRLEFRMEGYETRSIDIQARRGTKFDIDEKLLRIPGARRYSGGRRDSDPNAQRFWGKSRDSSETVTREPIDRKGDQRGPDGNRERETRLQLSAEPSDAAVYVDDRFIGTAEEVSTLRRGISLSPGKHTVTVLRPGFEGKTLDVQIDEGKTEELQVSLSR